MKQSHMPDQLTHENENVPPLSPKSTKKQKKQKTKQNQRLIDANYLVKKANELAELQKRPLIQKNIKTYFSPQCLIT